MRSLSRYSHKRGHFGRFCGNISTVSVTGDGPFRPAPVVCEAERDSVCGREAGRGPSGKAERDRVCGREAGRGPSGKAERDRVCGREADMRACASGREPCGAAAGGLSGGLGRKPLPEWGRDHRATALLRWL